MATLLQLQPHPEGGWYRRTFASAVSVASEATGAAAPASSAIYYLLPRGGFSAWHAVRGSDEVWHHYDGAPVELLVLDAEGRLAATTLGRDLAAGQRPQAVVAAGCWQAARAVGGWALCGCTVAPGFDFARFELPSREALLARFKDASAPTRAAIAALSRP